MENPKKNSFHIKFYNSQETLDLKRVSTMVIKIEKTSQPESRKKLDLDIHVKR